MAPLFRLQNRPTPATNNKEPKTVEEFHFKCIKKNLKGFLHSYAIRIAAMDLVKLSQFLQKCSLHVITVEDWILIQRASFDLHIDDLPYHSIQIYVKG